MKPNRLMIWAVMALLLVLGGPVAAQPGEHPPLHLPLVSGGDTPATVAGEPPPLHLPLIGVAPPAADAPAAFLDARSVPARDLPPPPIPYALVEGEGAAPTVDILLPPLDVDALREQDRATDNGDRALRIGVVRALPRPVTVTYDTAVPGRWRPTADGGTYWTLTLESPAAVAVRVHLVDLTIPSGGRLLVYNPRRVTEVYGPYSQAEVYDSGELWTASVFGPAVTLEFYLPPEIDPARVAPFRITEVSHVYREPAEWLEPALLGCHSDVACHASWLPEANGVAGLGTIGGAAGVLWCSGSLLNNYDLETLVGYFLTANHCLTGSNSVLGTQAQADTIEYYWRYQNATCNGTPPNPATVPRTATGADLISRQTKDAGNDHAFLRIRGALPGGLSLLGWDTASFGSGDSTIGIHHPDGSFKRISFGSYASSDSNYWRVNWSSGTTEPGSSGSPVFDAAHRVRGQLWGGNGVCPASGVTARSVYGRWDMTYPLVRRWLEIGGTIHVDSSYTGVEEGTPTKPFRTATAAHNFAWNDARLKFKGGSYPGAITFTKRVTLLGEGGLVTIGQ